MSWQLDRFARWTTAAALLMMFVAACTGGSSSASTPTAGLPSPAHTLPPGIVIANGRAAPSFATLQVSAAGPIDASKLHKAEYTQAAASEQARALLTQISPVRVLPLLTDRTSFASGAQITVAAARMGPSEHDVLYILQGPGGRWQRLVQAEHGVAVALVTLPDHLAVGTWALAVEDDSGIDLTPGSASPSGQIQLDLLTFRV